MGCSVSVSKARDCAPPPIKLEGAPDLGSSVGVAKSTQGLQCDGTGLDVIASGDSGNSSEVGPSGKGEETPPGSVWHTVEESETLIPDTPAGGAALSEATSNAEESETLITDTPAGGAALSEATGNAEDEPSHRPIDQDVADVELTFAGGGSAAELSEVLSHRQCHLKSLSLPGRYHLSFFEEAGAAINGLKSLEKLVCGSYGLKCASGFPHLSLELLVHVEIINISFGLRCLLSILKSSAQTLRVLSVVSSDEMRHETTTNLETLSLVLEALPEDIECLTLTKSLELSDLVLQKLEDRCLKRLKIANFSRSVCDPNSDRGGCTATSSRTSLCRSNSARLQPPLNEVLTVAAWLSLKAKYPNTAFSLDCDAVEFDNRKNMFEADAAHRPLKEAEFSGPKEKESCIF